SSGPARTPVDRPEGSSRRCCFSGTRSPRRTLASTTRTRVGGRRVGGAAPGGEGAKEEADPTADGDTEEEATEQRGLGRGAPDAPRQFPRPASRVPSSRCQRARRLGRVSGLTLREDNDVTFGKVKSKRLQDALKVIKCDTVDVAKRVREMKSCL
ncbi:hypothetical protein THAOC_18091, partial [Thalassiosira oceanica]